jgi:hypothetical protein
MPGGRPTSEVAYVWGLPMEDEAFDWERDPASRSFETKAAMLFSCKCGRRTHFEDPYVLTNMAILRAFVEAHFPIERFCREARL